MTSVPSGPVTVASRSPKRRRPSKASASESRKPGPPSDIGTPVTVSSGEVRSQPAVTACTASGAVSVPANLSMAMTMCTLRMVIAFRRRAL